MGEVVSGVATTVLGKLASEAYQEIALAWGLKGDVEKLRDSMRIISAFLIDAENKQFKNQSITEWLQQLRHAFFDASDILDEIECEAKINEVIKTYGSVAKKVSRFFSGSNPCVFRVKMAHKIKDVREKIDEIASHRNKFGLTEHHASDVALIRNLPWRETHSSLPSRVTGRFEEKEEIISLLTSQPLNSQVKNIGVVPIVAMGGWGKTALAQLVYNDERVIDHFELRMWVHVSHDFDVKRLISKILKAGDRTIKGGDDNFSLDELQTLLHEKLYEKKFLLVLDDIWNENSRRWHELRDLLLGTIGERNKNESKIMVTTRSHKVASIMGTVPEIKLEQLPEEECLELFVKCAFQEGEEEAKRYPMLKQIGKEIVAKCKGVPLAVVTLGCQLNSQHDENEWKKIRDSEMWEIDHQKDDDILPALRLSYSQLPSHLKRCFSYCAVFPKDYEYMDVHLISFWMAHGLLQPANENEDPLYLGELYFKQLISASFFQPVSEFEDPLKAEFFKLSGGYFYRMHDLVHDLAVLTMPGETAVMTSDTTFINEKVRHLSVSNNGDLFPSSPLNKNKVRSFGMWHTIPQEGIAVAEPFVKWIFKEFKYLRVLDLQDSKFQLLPDCFGKMKQLRFLSLMDCDKLEKLPNSICKLYNLQSLNLLGCEALIELPENLRSLVNLRILFITAQITDLHSIDIRCLKSLQILYLCGCENLVVLPRDLKHLIALKKLMILKCEKLAHFEDEGEKDGGGKQNEVVKDLSLQTFIVSESPILKALPSWLQRSAKTLQHMVIFGTSLTALPEWLANLASLNTLYIADCQELLSLPQDMSNLCSLQHLYIHACPELYARYERDIGPEWSKIAHVPNVYVSATDKCSTNLLRPFYTSLFALQPSLLYNSTYLAYLAFKTSLLMAMNMHHIT